MFFFTDAGQQDVREEKEKEKNKEEEGNNKKRW
jgi:hypothetical protein